jgi:transcriptional regulator with XRE-family HTH domain
MLRRELREFIGARIRKVRTARGLSIEELMHLSDVPELMIGMIERGRKRISFENMLCLARALGVPVMDFFGDAEE